MPKQDLPTFGLIYDFRNPEQWHQSPEALYRSSLDQIVWAESLGIRSTWITEHHFCDDGYTPSPLTIAAAIGARTTEMFVGTNVLLLPLHDPIRVAEDAATVSILTGGRFRLGIGLGYRQLEYDTFGRKMTNRPSLMEEAVDIIRQAWSGKPVTVKGKRFTVDGVRITPVPENPPPILMGALAPAPFDRVARLSDGYLCTVNNDLALQYFEALEKQGKDPAEGKVYALQFAIIDEDPEKAWAEMAPHALYQWNEYISWGVFGPPEDIPRYERPEQLIEAGLYQLMDAGAAIDTYTNLVRDRPQFKDLIFVAQLPGEPVERGSRRVEYLATKVMPEVHKRLSQ